MFMVMLNEKCLVPTNLDGLSSENDEVLGTLAQETNKLFAQKLFKVISLLNLDADADGVDGRLDQNTLVGVTTDDDWVQNQLLVLSEWNSIYKIIVVKTF